MARCDGFTALPRRANSGTTTQMEMLTAPGLLSAKAVGLIQVRSEGREAKRRQRVSIRLIHPPHTPRRPLIAGR